MIILMILFITEIWLWQAVWRLSRRLFQALHSAGSVSIKTYRLQTQQLPLIQWFRLLDVKPHHQAPEPQTITITTSISAPTATTHRHRTASCIRNWAFRKCNRLWMPPPLCVTVSLVSCLLTPSLYAYTWRLRGVQAFKAAVQWGPLWAVALQWRFGLHCRETYFVSLQGDGSWSN